MFNLLHVLFYYLKKIVMSGYTYFMIGTIFLLIIAKNFRQEQMAQLPIEEEPTTQEKIVNYALSLKGIDYRSGGISTEGFDCSGFTYFVFKEFGYQLPRSSRAQFTAGAAINLEELNKADLVFFKGRNLKSQSIGHVGIIINQSENGEVAFVHASSSRGVRIDSLSNPYYSPRYLGSRRIFSLNSN
jgi:cell wall-associated NlpC family hydrolase